MKTKPPIKAQDIDPVNIVSIYPEPFYSLMHGRIKRRLGDFFGLNNFGINLTRLKPNGISALFHKHNVQDEFIYILEGNPTIITEAGEFEMSPNMCIGFPKGGSAHQLVNKSEKDVLYLEIGDRLPNDEAEYPNDDIAAKQDEKGKWVFFKKDGTPY